MGKGQKGAPRGGGKGMVDKEQLYKEFYPKVFGYVRSKVNPSDAEDVTANVFVKVYANLERFDEQRASLSTWIYTITHNTVIDHWKRQEKAPLSLEAHLEYLTEETQADDMLQTLSEALEKLTSIQRNVVILHYYFGLQHTEIARKLRLTPANTRKICSLALAALRKNMNP